MIHYIALGGGKGEKSIITLGGLDNFFKTKGALLLQFTICLLPSILNFFEIVLM